MRPQLEPHEARAILAKLQGHPAYSRAHYALGMYKLEAIAEPSPQLPARHVKTCPNPPAEHTLCTARDIRFRFGHGGANFPGARELYAAAEAIEAWAAEWEQPREPDNVIREGTGWPASRREEAAS